MNKTTTVLAAVATLLLVGFIYLRSQNNLTQTDENSVNKTASSSASNNINSENQNSTMTPTPKEIKQYDSPPPLTIDTSKQYTAILNTSKGTMKIKLFASEVPNTVNNFIFLAKEGFYDQTIFHRVIANFMIQGGDPRGDGTGGPGYKFDDEPISRQYIRGTVAMANSGPNTNGSQFFIMHKDYELPEQYVIFGMLEGEESFETLDAIAQTPVTANALGERSQPTHPIVLQSIKVLEE